eukprot:TRINITY_DN38550_c0_g1_i1.p1 TRINITY_DN38550_c0_g1~~TRINITY_DN38550_c0_g1_i1.p1  ORF type:complete len:254 (+),score=57.23 TRINITY_DN38550_c0_g1_i1:49-810(+)
MRMHGLSSSMAALTSAMRGVGDAGLWASALRLCKEAGQRGGEVDLIARNCLAAQRSQSASWMVALETVAEASNAGQAPDEYSYSAGLRYDVAWDVATGLLRDMRLRSMPTSPVCLHAALGSCTAASLWPRTLAALLLVQPGRALQRDVFSLNINLAMLAEAAGSWHDALEGLAEASQVAISIDMVSCNSVMDACSKNAAMAATWRKTLSMLVDADMLQLRRSCISFNSAMAAAAQADHWSVSSSLLSALLYRW